MQEIQSSDDLENEILWLTREWVVGFESETEWGGNYFGDVRGDKLSGETMDWWQLPLKLVFYLYKNIPSVKDYNQTCPK